MLARVENEVPVGLQIAASVGTVVAALAAAYGAFQARDAARASRTTSERATAALGESSKPNPQVIPKLSADGRLEVTVSNYGQFAAADVEITVTLVDGRQEGRSWPIISPGRLNEGAWDYGPFVTTGPVPGSSVYDVETVTLLFSDEHRFARWLRQYEWTGTTFAHVSDQRVTT